MAQSLGASITKAGSRQAYYTFLCLADRDRVEDAFRAYAYFRWLDDCLDTGTLSQAERMALLVRQQDLLDRCYRSLPVKGTRPEEQLLVELIRHDLDPTSGLHTYLYNMMAVLAFDAGRCGRIISQKELDQYMLWLASSVTEVLHYFIGHDAFSPQGENRYMAVMAAHISHMLRDTFEDINAGYFNIPVEVLKEHDITPADTDSEAYRAWVRNRVELARSYFQAGRVHIQKTANARCRIAGFSYIARFEWLLDTIEKEGFRLRPAYDERKSAKMAWRMNWATLASMLGLHPHDSSVRPVATTNIKED